MIKISPIELKHIEGVLEIYRPYVLNTPITFEYDVPSLADFTQRVLSIKDEYPYLVCMYQNKVVAYGYAHRFKERKAYDWDVELSVYVHQDYRGYYLGRALYQALIDILIQQNIRNIYSFILADNESSRKLHEWFGFREVGRLIRTGFKFGQWHDDLVYEKAIGLLDDFPRPFVPYQNLESDDVKTSIANAQVIIRQPE